MTMFERIEFISKKRGMSLREVNEKAKLGTNAIYRWKKQTPSVDKIKAVANVLNVSVDYLLGKESKTNNAKHADLLDKDIILAFDGKDISESEKEKILDYARYVLAQREAKKHE